MQAVHDGAIGKVKEVHSWQAGEMEWLVTETRPKETDPVPQSLNWDVWLGVAPVRPYKKGLVSSVELASVAGFQLGAAR